MPSGIFRLTEELVEKLGKRHFEEFLKRHKIPHTGTRSDLMARINSIAEKGNISSVELYNWWLNALKDANRHLYVFPLSDASCCVLRDVKNLKSQLEEHEFINPERFVTDATSERVVLSCELFQDEDETINQVNLGFVQQKIRIDLDKHKETIMRTYYPYRTFVEFDLENRELRIFADQKQDVYEPNEETYISSRNTAESLAKELRDKLGIQVLQAGIYGKTLYSIQKEATGFLSGAFQAKIDSLSELTGDYLRQVEERLDVSILNSSEIVTRFQGLIERTLVQFSDLNVVDYLERDQKNVSVMSFKFRDDTGARVEAKSLEKSTLHETDIFYDTRDTIDLVSSLIRIHVYWRFGEDNKEISTILSVEPTYLQIVFTTAVTREEIEHVLSGIGEFKERLSLGDD